MGSYEDNHEIAKHSDFVGCKRVAGERISGSHLMFNSVMWTAAATNPYKLNVNLAALLHTADGQISIFSVNASLPSAVAQCLLRTCSKITLFLSLDGLKAE